MFNLKKLIYRHRNANWALADQSVVSGSNFVSGILLARFLGPEAFGLFVLLQAVIPYVNSFQGSLIFQPMMSAAPQLLETDRLVYLQGIFSLQLMLTFFLATITALLLFFANTLFGFHGLQQLDIVALTAALLAFQLQDWQRRYYFVQHNARAAFFNDMVNYGGQITLLLIACLTGHLNVANAFWIIASCAFTAFIIGFFHSKLLPIFVHARAVLADGWRSGCDYLASWQLQWIGTQGVFMLGASIVGTQAVGATRATQNIVGPINILFQAMENLMPIKAAQHYGNSGLPGLMRFLRRITLIGTLILVPILLLLSLFASPLIHFLYGEKYVAFASLVYWQAAYIFIQFYQRQTFYFLRTLKETRVILLSSVLTAACCLSVAALTVNRFHETGLMMALVSGTGIALIYSLIASRNIMRQLAHQSRPMQNIQPTVTSPIDMRRHGVNT